MELSRPETIPLKTAKNHEKEHGEYFSGTEWPVRLGLQ
jgi:hypothetical protein